MTFQTMGQGVYTYTEALSAAECQSLLQASEQHGYREAPITTALGFVMAPEVRNNTRVMLDDQARADWLWQRLGPSMPAPESGVLVGLNERLRYYRYRTGQYFEWHRDGAFRRGPRECSRRTLIVYLNDDFNGGHTQFEHCPAVVPRRGLALLFEHHLRHRGAPVTAGTKYVLRTDVMVRWDVTQPIR